jgi:hypothetical protein
MLARPLSLVFLGLLATSLLACGREPRERLQGNWQGIAVDGLSGDQLSKAEGWARGTRLEFIGNKVTVGMPAESPRSGTFRVASIDGDRVRVQFKRPEGGEDLAEFRFAKDGTLRWQLGDAQVVLSKLQSKSKG